MNRNYAAAFWMVAALFFRTASAVDAPSPGALPLPPIPPPLPVSAVGLPPVELGASFPDGISIQQFARVVLLDVLKKPFVFSSDFIGSTAFVGFNATNLKKDGIEELLRDVLKEHGYSLTYRAGYYRVEALRPEDRPDLRQDFVYRLRHRDLGYISTQLQPLFPAGGFTFQRALDPPQPQESSGSRTFGSPSSGSPAPVDDGQSLYSMTSKSDADLLIFRGLPADIDRLRSILDQLDVPVPRVLVRAVVLETSASSIQGYSVSAVASMLSGKLGLEISGSQLGNLLTFNSGSFDAVVAALQGDSKVRVLTAPAVFAETGASASLSVGNSVPTLGAITYSGDGSSQQSVSYQDTGVILRVTPRVFEDSVSLSVTQEISDAVTTETGVDNSPTITKRQLTTTLNMASGDTVILGGLTSTKSERIRDSLPFWRRITLGKLKTTNQTDIVVVLHVERV